MPVKLNPINTLTFQINGESEQLEATRIVMRDLLFKTGKATGTELETLNNHLEYLQYLKTILNSTEEKLEDYNSMELNDDLERDLSDAITAFNTQAVLVDGLYDSVTEIEEKYRSRKKARTGDFFRAPAPAESKLESKPISRSSDNSTSHESTILPEAETITKPSRSV